MALSIRSSFVKSVKNARSQYPPKQPPGFQAVYTDNQVAARILEILRQAKEYVVLVSPYLSLWHDLQDAISTAVNRGVDVEVMICQDQISKNSEDITWLMNASVEVCCVATLHANLYLNETSVIVSSMNLADVSSTNSREIAVIIQDAQNQSDIRSYVETLLALAEPVGDNPDQEPTDTPIGSCIRCRRPLYFEPDKPLCTDCFASWFNHQDLNYEEAYCHACGTDEWEVTYASPLCRPCYNLSLSY